ncbi:hypothetical protein EYF80_009017 [Liparis tanakae]|uniref:Uncharacterized protein n=1 Tax=Liparis tanakae TaxID=230148 RepID=A0A4Z2IU96_9TELE|nr:hypothetical protein EYF80_009017 [Liparis tanakae]
MRIFRLEGSLESHCRQSHIEQSSQWGLGGAEDEQETTRWSQSTRESSTRSHTKLPLFRGDCHDILERSGNVMKIKWKQTAEIEPLGVPQPAAAQLAQLQDGLHLQPHRVPRLTDHLHDLVAALIFHIPTVYLHQPVAGHQPQRQVLGAGTGLSKVDHPSVHSSIRTAVQHGGATQRKPKVPGVAALKLKLAYFWYARCDHGR